VPFEAAAADVAVAENSFFVACLRFLLALVMGLQALPHVTVFLHVQSPALMDKIGKNLAAP